MQSAAAVASAATGTGSQLRACNKNNRGGRGDLNAENDSIDDEDDGDDDDDDDFLSSTASEDELMDHRLGAQRHKNSTMTTTTTANANNGDDEDDDAFVATRILSKQMQTLRSLRRALYDNQQLKRRVEIVEAELANYERFGRACVAPLDAERYVNRHTQTRRLRTSIEAAASMSVDQLGAVTADRAQSTAFTQQLLDDDDVIVHKVNRETSSDDTLQNRGVTKSIVNNSQFTRSVSTTQSSSKRESNSSDDENENDNDNDNIDENDFNELAASSNIRKAATPLVAASSSAPASPRLKTAETEATASLAKPDGGEMAWQRRASTHSDRAAQCDEDTRDKELIAQLRRQVAMLEHDRIHEQAEWSSTRVQLADELAHSAGRLRSAESAAEQLASRLAEAVRDTRALQHAESEARSLAERLALLQAEHAQLQAAAEERADLLAQRDSSLADAQHAQEALVDRTRALSERLATLESDNERLRAPEAHTQCVLNVEEAHAQWRTASERADTMQAECERQRALVELLGKQVDRYKQEQQQFNFKEFVSLRRELNTLRADKERQFAAAAAAAAAAAVANPGNAASAATAINSPPLPPIKPNIAAATLPKKNLFNFFPS